MAINLSELRRNYEAKRFAYIPSIITAIRATYFHSQVADLPSRRVICGNKDITWDEQDVPKDNELFQFFASTQILALLQHILAINIISSEHCYWVSRYSKGEHISKHKDIAGTIQIVLCLKSSTKENGGILFLKPKGKLTELYLNPGDAVLFPAVAVEHWTTPLIPTDKELLPSRIVAVSRYFIDFNCH